MMRSSSSHEDEARERERESAVREREREQRESAIREREREQRDLRMNVVPNGYRSTSTQPVSVPSTVCLVIFLNFG